MTSTSEEKQQSEKERIRTESTQIGNRVFDSSQAAIRVISIERIHLIQQLCLVFVTLYVGGVFAISKDQNVLNIFWFIFGVISGGIGLLFSFLYIRWWLDFQDEQLSKFQDVFVKAALKASECTNIDMYHQTDEYNRTVKLKDKLFELEGPDYATHFILTFFLISYFAGVCALLKFWQPNGLFEEALTVLIVSLVFIKITADDVVHNIVLFGMRFIGGIFRLAIGYFKNI